MLSSKLLEIAQAFKTLGWQSEDTFQPVLMALVGDDLEVKCLNRLREMWDKLEIIDVVMIVAQALRGGPDEMREMLFEDTKDIRGLALMTEGWAVIGKTIEEVAEKLEDDPRERADRIEHRVVLGMLFEDLVSDEPVVWGANHLRDHDDHISVERGYGGGLSDAFFELVKQAGEVLCPNPN